MTRNKFYFFLFFLVLIILAINFVNAGNISYDNMEYISEIYLWNGTVTDKVTSFTGSNKIFEDTAQINNSIYFSSNSYTCSFHNLTFNISVPVNASSFQVIWEYNIGPNIATSSYWVPLDVIDNTNSFTTSGVNQVSFQVPPNWLYASVPSFINESFSASGYEKVIRARIINVSGITEGGHIYGKQYYYDNTISVTGFNNSLSFIYNQSLANNWSVVFNYNSYYALSSNLRLGNSSSTTNNSLIIRNWEILEIGNSTNKACFSAPYTSDTNYLIIGNLTTNNQTLESSYVKVWQTSCAEPPLYNLELYSSTYVRLGECAYYPLMSGEKVLNSIIDADSSVYHSAGYKGYIINSVLGTKGSRTYLYNSALDISNVILSSGLGTLTGSSSLVRNVYFPLGKVLYGANANIRMYCVDCSFYDITSQLTPGVDSNIIYINATLTIDVYDNNGSRIYDANVTIRNNANITIFNKLWTNYTSITYYKRNTTAYYAYNPHTISIYKDGLATYNTIINISNDNKYLSITLTDPCKDTSTVTNICQPDFLFDSNTTDYFSNNFLYASNKIPLIK